VANKGSVIPLSAIFALRDIKIHIGPSDGSNKAADIEAAIDKFLCYGTTL